MRQRRFRAPCFESVPVESGNRNFTHAKINSAIIPLTRTQPSLWSEALYSCSIPGAKAQD